MMQLQKQNPYYALASLGVNSTLINLYQAHVEEKKFRQFSTDEDDDSLIDVIMKWYIYTGISGEPTAADFVINCNFIKANFPDLNLTDINMAMNLSANGKLDMQKSKSDESFSRFSPTYIGRVLRAYIDNYRSENIFDVRAKIRKLEIMESESRALEIPENERILIFQRLLNTAFSSGLESENFHDWGNIIYFFIKKKYIDFIKKDMVAEALSYGEKMHSMNTKRESNTQALKDIKIEKPKNRKESVENYARNFVVNRWLRQFNGNRKKEERIDEINEIIRNVNIEDLQ